MKLKLLAIFVALLFQSSQAYAKSSSPKPVRKFTIDLWKEHVVPKGRYWKISGLKPYFWDDDKKGIGTADFKFYGEIFIAGFSIYSINGQYSLTLGQIQHCPILISAGTTVEVDDSRYSAKVEEFKGMYVESEWHPCESEDLSK